MKELSLHIYMSPFCSTCKNVISTIELLNKIIKNVNFTIINIHESISLASDNKVAAIPTTIIYKDKIETNRFVGAIQIKTIIEELLSDI